ncbi:hypothetical protein Taro_003204 [Colocasia esculenta]|uniref:Uncharacterized protein n=1 Tax=Colocasia esculenta TaxID=4460 RepID=A0A843TKY2_COLES|nr:hypothetical protein [Colocasia esculenta]
MQEEWRVQMLPIQFLFASVNPVVVMHPHLVPPHVPRVLELQAWELKGLEGGSVPPHLALDVRRLLYPTGERRGAPPPGGVGSEGTWRPASAWCCRWCRSTSSRVSRSRMASRAGAEEAGGEDEAGCGGELALRLPELLKGEHEETADQEERCPMKSDSI